MQAIIAQNQRETGEGGPPNHEEVDGIRMSAKLALDTYLSMPLSDDPFTFWLNHSRTTDRAQKCLCDLARKYLTPPATSTDVESKLRSVDLSSCLTLTGQIRYLPRQSI